MGCILKNEYFLILVLLTSQAFSSAPMEDDADFSELVLEAMKANLGNARADYNLCCFYKDRSTMPEELQNIINRSANLSSLPKDWQDRFIRHIVSTSKMEDEDFDDFLSHYRFHKYSRGARKAYVNGMCLMTEGLVSLYKSLKEDYKESNAGVFFLDNGAVDVDHWTRIGR